MAESKVVSIRIPQELLDAVDRLAAVRHPSRRGGEPNRSQLILDLLEQGIQTADDDAVNKCHTVSTEAIETRLDALVEEKLFPIQSKLAALESVLGEYSA
jgi:metal-responsive CopG/Arc/MetJ family transcriptional regulator